MSSANDKAVLDSIFNPLLPGLAKFQTTTPETETQNQENGEVFEAERKEVIQLETEGVKEAECGNLEAALERFDKAIDLSPTRASSYNNRAQARRLKGDIEGALEDLERAVVISDGRGKVGANALCQRAQLYRLVDRNEEAMADFSAAAQQGNEFAKNQLIQLNPYAALCNQMLGSIMSKLGQDSDQSNNKRNT